MYHRYQVSLKRRTFGPLSTNGSSGEYGQDRTMAELGEGIASVMAGRDADRYVERHRFAARPAGVIGPYFSCRLRTTETG